METARGRATNHNTDNNMRCPQTVSFQKKDKNATPPLRPETIKLPQEIHANHGQINWYPGHMARAEREIMETYRKEVDFVVEVRDARLPFSTAADRLADLVGNKPRLILLNKSDLACPEATKDAVNVLRKDYDNVIATSIHSNRSGNSASKIVSKLRDKVPQRFRTLDALVLICGVPNVGKSTVINAIRNVCMRRESRSVPKTRRNNKNGVEVYVMCWLDRELALLRRNQPTHTREYRYKVSGVTTSVSRIRVSSDPPIAMVDTPGIITSECWFCGDGIESGAHGCSA